MKRKNVFKSEPVVGDLLLADKCVLRINTIFMTDSCSVINYECTVLDELNETVLSCIGCSVNVNDYDVYLNCSLDEIEEKYPEIYI